MDPSTLKRISADGTALGVMPLILGADRVIVAFSGGADSSLLLLYPNFSIIILQIQATVGLKYVNCMFTFQKHDTFLSCIVLFIVI